jgi:hypothetical protein
VGADAAVLAYDRTKRIDTVYRGPWWARSSYAVHGRRIVAEPSATGADGAPERSYSFTSEPESVTL